MAEYAEIFQQILEQLKPGGVMEQAQLADIKTGKKRAIAKAKGGLISSGLGGTTLMGAAPIAAEEGAARSRLAVKAAGTKAYTGALGQFAALTEQTRQRQLDREATRSNLELSLSEPYSQRVAAQNAMTLAANPASGITSLPGRNLPMSGGVSGGASGGLPSATGGYGQPSAQTMPSLYGGGGDVGAAPDLFGGGSGGATWTPGEFAGSFNGERYVYNAEGQIVKESEAEMGVGRTEAAQAGIAGGMETTPEQQDKPDYASWWNTMSSATKKTLGLTAMMAPGGPWAWMGATIMAGS